MPSTLRDWIDIAFDRMGDLPPEVTDNLDVKKQQIEAYFTELRAKNKVLNLTARDSDEELGILHLLDSLTLFRMWPKLGAVPDNYLDLGTGAGLPGLILKILLPDLDVVLMDSLQKRLRFLSDVKADLGLKKLELVHARFEDAGRDPAFRERFQLVTARAVAKMPQLLEYAAPFMHPSGNLIAMKGDKLQRELKEAQNAARLLKLKLGAAETFTLPETDMTRGLVIFQKAGPTPKKYPRRPKDIKERPL